MLLARTNPETAVEGDGRWGVPDVRSAAEPLHSITRERRRVLALIALVWLIVAGLYMLPTLVNDRRDIGVPIIISHLGVSMGGLALSVLLLLIIARASRAGKRAAFFGSALGVVSIAALLAAIDIAFFDFVHGLFDREQAPGVPYIARWTANFAVFMSQFSLIAVTFWMIETLEANRVKQVELEQSRRLIVEAQNTAGRAKLAALRYQLNPHFLFNTLNSISSLVMTKRLADAENMLSLLSEFLRSTLAQDPEAPQTLEGELETVEAYLAIERIRFGERMAIEIDCPPALRDTPIAHFLLQPLVENAIKHGVAPSQKPVTIRIAARANDGDLIVAIENDCQTGQASATSTRVGLRNVRERLAAVYGNEGHLETIERESGYLALVRIPLGSHIR
jgi:hypothetical protein